MRRREAVLLALLLALPPLLLQLAGPVPRLDADAVEYYAHLRSLYFDRDVEFTNEFAHFAILDRWDKTQLTSTGHRRTNFSVGPALLWMPFYAAGDAVARLSGEVEDGYSPAHVRAVALGTLVLGLLGLLLLGRVLRDVASAPATRWTLLVVLYGTFLLWYLVHEPVQSHGPGFFAAAAFLHEWWRRRQAPSPRGFLWLGLLAGLATTVRWQNAVLLLTPTLGLLLQRAATGQSTPGGEVRRRLLAGAALLPGFLVGVLPQLLVFEAIFGVYWLPYPVQGRDYLLLGRPSLLETFFSSRHGLLFWTPVLWAGFLGLVPLVRRQARTFVPLVVPVLVMSYVNACAGDWWAGGSFSNRRFDSVLPVLALGLALSLDALLRWASRRPGQVLAAAAALLTIWNLLFMEQFRRGLVPRDDTVSFPQVAQNNVALVAEWAGSPVTWPASWLFAWRHGLPPAQYDVAVGKYLFHRQNNLGGVIDVGTGEAGADLPLLGEGFGVRVPCGGSLCRAVEGRARLFAPLYLPEALDVVVVAEGEGTLDLAVNGRPVAAWGLGPELTEHAVRVPGSVWRRELNELALTVSAGGRAAVDRVRFGRLERR